MFNIMQRYILLTLIFITLFSPVLHADQLLQKAKLWMAIDLKGSLTEKTQYYLEPQLRFISDSKTINEENMYVGLGYTYTPRVNFWVGNTYQKAYKTSGNNTQQYRIWEQISWDIYDTQALQIDSRTRLEERKQEYSTSWNLRLRERVTFNFPLKNNHAIVIYDEIFFSLNNTSWVNDAFINQNRLFIGISKPLARKALHLDVGYLNQFVSDNPNQLNHVLNFVLKIRR